MTYYKYIQSKEYKEAKITLLEGKHCDCCAQDEDLFLLRNHKLIDLFEKYGKDIIKSEEFNECVVICNTCYKNPTKTLKRLLLNK